MSAHILRQVSIIACLAGIATALVFFIAVWRGTLPPLWMPALIGVVGSYELVQWGQGLWARRVRR